MKASIPALAFATLIACGGSSAPSPAAPFERDLDLAEPATPEPPAAGAPGAAAEPRWSDPAPRPARTIYRGRPIDLDFKDVDLSDVFRLLADVGDVNIVIADDVKGKLTLRMRRVPWDQALETIVKVKRLELERSGSVYLVRQPQATREAGRQGMILPPEGS